MGDPSPSRPAVETLFLSLTPTGTPPHLSLTPTGTPPQRAVKECQSVRGRERGAAGVWAGGRVRDVISVVRCQLYPLLLSSLEMCHLKFYEPWDGPASVQGYLAHKKTHPPRTLP